MNKQPKLIIITFIYAALFLTILVLAYTGNLGTYLSRLAGYDILGHFILYGAATYLGHSLLIKQRFYLWRYAIPLWPFMFFLFTITEESLQALSPNRTFSWHDMIASLLGLLVGYWLAEKKEKKLN